MDEKIGAVFVCRGSRQNFYVSCSLVILPRHIYYMMNMYILAVISCVEYVIEKLVEHSEI